MKSSRSLDSRKKNPDRDVQLLIEKFVYGGVGLARREGKVYLVRYSLPGEVVKAEILKDQRDHTEATTSQTLLPSPGRREPFCPYYGKCGGCHVQHATYEYQLKLKEEVLKETLKRLGGLDKVPRIKVIPSPSETSYRIRVQFKSQSGSIGFYRWGEREIVDIENCPVAHSRINDLIPHLKEISKVIETSAEFHITYSPSEDKFLLSIISPAQLDRATLRSLKDLLPNEVVGVGNFARPGGTMSRRNWLGQEHLYFEVGPYRYRVSSDSFFQVNYLLWQEFIESVVNGAEFRKGIELFCGAGFFSIPLSEKGNFLEASDSNPHAINDAVYNAKVNGRENLLFLKSGAYRHLKMRGGDVIDLLLLDPPRGGLGKMDLEMIASNKPERIIYVSCNPSTLARDLKFLTQKGYSLQGIKMIDLFPQTYHIESICHLVVHE